MARGDKRKRNIKRDWTVGGASTVQTSSLSATNKQYKFKKDSLPNLGKLGQRLASKVQAEKQKKELVAMALKQKMAQKLAQEGESVSVQSLDQMSMLEMAKKASSRGIVYNQGAAAASENHDASFQGTDYGDAAITGKKDNSRKAYYKEFKKVVQQADVILEILDARDPLGCRTREVEELIMNAGSDKKIVLILNKIDLVPRDTVEAWLKYLRNEFPTVAFKASTQTQRSNLGQSQVSAALATDELLSGSESVGADNLIKLLKNYCRNVNIKTSITVGVVGFPNVGKSSVINSLKRSKVCGVGATPGVTKVAQTIHLDKNIKLLDCPGIVFSQSSSSDRKESASVLLRNCVKVELLEDPVSPVEVILERCSKEVISQVYGVTSDFNNTNEFLVLYARHRGKLLKGGIPDVDNAARSIIQDWNTGKIPFYTVPPVLGLDKGFHVESSVVQEMAAEFNIDNLMDGVQVEAPRSNVAAPIDEPLSMGMDHDDDYDDMQVEDVQTSSAAPLLTEIRFKAPVVRKVDTVGGVAAPVVGKTFTVFTEEEAIINPQIGGMMKKMAKKLKKDKRRAQKVLLDEMEE